MNPPAPNEGTPKDATNRPRHEEPDKPGGVDKKPNPPRTKLGPIVSPKFGSAGSGGAELEPGPERD
jgi:hypothetical protein